MHRRLYLLLIFLIFHFKSELEQLLLLLELVVLWFEPGTELDLLCIGRLGMMFIGCRGGRYVENLDATPDATWAEAGDITETTGQSDSD